MITEGCCVIICLRSVHFQLMSMYITLKALWEPLGANYDFFVSSEMWIHHMFQDLPTS